MISKQSMIRQLKSLPKSRGKVKIGSEEKTAKIICQWHYVQGKDRESTPSFIVNLQNNGKYHAGTGRCFGCGKYIKKFEAIIDPSKESLDTSLGEDEDEYVQPLYNESVDAILHDEDEETGHVLPNALPWLRHEDWRTINGQLMYLIGAKQFYKEEFEKIMAYLPCNVNGKEVGHIEANLQKEGKRNYFNKPGPWVKETGLFPYDFVVKYLKRYKLKTIVPVEGPRDALRCLQFGIPALAILGTQNWSENKAELISNLNVERIISAMDGDKAGILATNAVFESFKGEIDTYNFRFDKYGEKLDPGNCPKEIMRKLRSFVI